MNNETLKDKALEDLFLAARPQFADTDRFLAQLNRRLDAVEFLKQHEEASIRRYKIGMVVAFALGIVCGGGLLAFIASIPADVPLFTFGVSSSFLLLIEHNSHVIALIMLSALICFGIISTVSIIQDLLNMRDMDRIKLKQHTI